MQRIPQRLLPASLRLCLLASVATVCAALIDVAPSPARAAVENGQLPIPRFVSLRSSQVNMRSGPGVRYPVTWIYMRRDLPVEITAEFETWRKIKDIDGAEGWVHQSMVTGRRMAQIRADGTRLRSSADDNSGNAAILQAGVQGKIRRCPVNSDFCEIEVENYDGWVRRGEVWGVYKNEGIE